MKFPCSTISPFVMRLLFFLPSLCVRITSTGAQSYVPVDISGYNEDLIASGSSSVISASTAGFDGPSCDGNDNVYYEKGFNQDYPGTGLPANRIVNSSTNPGYTYKLAPYNGNNAFHLIDELNDTKTVTLLQPGAFSRISLLAAAAGVPGGSASFNAIVNFSDGTSQSASFVVEDWFGSGQVAVGSLGRAQRCTDNRETNGSSPKLFDCTFDISASNQAKVINSITLTKTGIDGFVGVFALCGITPAGTPGAPVAIAATNDTGTSFKANWNAPTSGAAPTSYVLDVSTSADFNTASILPAYNNLDVGNVLNYQVTGLGCGTYYYRVRARNSLGTGPNSAVISL